MFYRLVMDDELNQDTDWDMSTPYLEYPAIL